MTGKAEPMPGTLIVGGLIAVMILVAAWRGLHQPLIEEPSPTIGEFGFSGADAFSGLDEQTFMIDVNHAGVTELQLLRGVGRVLADRIVAHRESHGPFESIDEIVVVHGIGPGTLANISDHAFAGQPIERPPGCGNICVPAIGSID